jgi:hypothetical protein
MRKTWFVITLVLVLALAACGGDDEGDSGADDGGGEVAATVTSAPSPTTMQDIPTWTPGDPPTRIPDTPTAAGDDAADSGGAGDGSYGPTWTPVPSPTPIPTLTPSITPTYTLTPTALPPECFELLPVEMEDVTYAGYSIAVRWQIIPDFQTFPKYLLRVYKGDRTNEVYHQHIDPLEAIVPGTDTAEVVVPGDVFKEKPGRQVYGWEVWAIDVNGELVCFSISGEIIVEPGEPPTATPLAPAGDAAG